MTARAGRWRGDPVTALGVIAEAFQIKDWQVMGAPSWAKTDPFAIDATTSDNVSREMLIAQLPRLLVSMLEDRFQLKAHREQRRLRVYALVRAHADGRLGPQLRRSEVDCEALTRERAAEPETKSPPLPRSTERQVPMCSGSSQQGWIVVLGRTMQAFAQTLTSVGFASSDRVVVVDRTSLSGAFDFALRWSEGLDGNPLGAAMPVPAGAPEWLRNVIQSAPPANGVSVFTALPEQLGLKLESRDELLDVLVIDHIERPTPN